MKTTADYTRYTYYPPRTVLKAEGVKGQEPCNCIGPQNNEPHCPCVMRQERIDLDGNKYYPGDNISRAKGQPMPDTREGWKHLADQYAKTIVQQKDEISRLKRKINKLEQRNG